LGSRWLISTFGWMVFSTYVALISTNVLIYHVFLIKHVFMSFSSSTFDVLFLQKVHFVEFYFYYFYFPTTHTSFSCYWMASCDIREIPSDRTFLFVWNDQVALNVRSLNDFCVLFLQKVSSPSCNPRLPLDAHFFYLFLFELFAFHHALPSDISSYVLSHSSNKALLDHSNPRLFWLFFLVSIWFFAGCALLLQLVRKVIINKRIQMIEIWITLCCKVLINAYDFDLHHVFRKYVAGMVFSNVWIPNFISLLLLIEIICASHDICLPGLSNSNLRSGYVSNYFVSICQSDTTKFK
jgi:hypothetical protein